MGRPKLEINEEQVYECAKLYMPVKDIALVCDCSVATLEARFLEVIAKGRAEGRKRLRAKQWECAMRGNITMLIFLGKAYLDQEDVHKNEVTVTTRTEDAFSDWLRDHPELTEPIVDTYSGNGGQG